MGAFQKLQTPIKFKSAQNTPLSKKPKRVIVKYAQGDRYREANINNLIPFFTKGYSKESNSKPQINYGFRVGSWVKNLP